MRLYKILTPIIVVANFAVAMGLLASAYAGSVDPCLLSISTVVTMTFPAWIVATVFMAVIDLLWWRMQTVIPGIAFFICLPMIWSYCPLNIGSHTLSDDEKPRSFTLMTYNVNDYYDQRGLYPDSLNPTIRFILNSSPDIVCMQDCEFMSAMKHVYITQAQVDSVHNMYPYIFLSGRAQCVMSKYPLTALPLDQKVIGDMSADIAAYRLNVKGRELTIFNVHLCSLGLTRDDKKLYKDVIKMQGNDRISEVKHQLISKISQAGVTRAYQTGYLLKLIKHYGGDNVIVCGDFNDVPGCYAIRQIEDHAGMHSAYTKAGFGPGITYNDNRLYFRIDHILYRGDFSPVDIHRTTIKTSDHYPLTATFVWKDGSSK